MKSIRRKQFLVFFVSVLNSSESNLLVLYVCVLGIIDQTLSTVSANLVSKAYVTKCDEAQAQHLKNSPWRKKEEENCI